MASTSVPKASFLPRPLLLLLPLSLPCCLACFPLPGCLACLPCLAAWLPFPGCLAAWLAHARLGR
eukprot:45019-Heterocapsa_arctica.AAC.1